MTFEIVADGSRPQGGHVILKIKGAALARPPDGLELHIRRLSHQAWLGQGWQDKLSGLRVPAESIVAAPDGLYIRLGPEVVSHMAPGIGLFIEIESLGVSGRVRWPSVMTTQFEDGSEGAIAAGPAAGAATVWHVPAAGPELAAEMASPQLPLEAVAELLREAWWAAREARLERQGLDFAQTAGAPPPSPQAPQSPPSPPWAPPSASSMPDADRSRAPKAGGARGGIALLVLAPLIAVAWLWRKEIMEHMCDLLALLGLTKCALPPGGLLPSSMGSARKDIVDCSVFAPPAMTRGQRFQVQVFLHIPADADRARFLARTMDRKAELRDFETLSVPIARGARIEVRIDGRGLEVAEQAPPLVWRGEPVVAKLSCRIPPDSREPSFLPVAQLMVDGYQVGRVLFEVEARASGEAADAAVAEAARITGRAARRSQKVFISYASPDRGEALRRAQALQSAGFDVFQDVLRLEPGERYEPKILGEIERSDQFMLVWSRHASASEWVRKEWVHARDCQRRSRDGLPDIKPLPLEGPDRVPPPEELSDIHFNSVMLPLIEQADNRRGGWLARLLRR